MKKKIFAALSAAVLLCGALTAPAAAESTDRNGFFLANPKIWTDPDSGTVYYSNWSVKLSAQKKLYAEKGKPYAVITFQTAQASADKEALLSVCQTYFDESYQISCIGTSFAKEQEDAVSAWSVTVRDQEQRPETAEKAEQLFRKLEKQYQLLDYQYCGCVETFTEISDLTRICEYFYQPNNNSFGTNDPDTEKKLTALITEKYPEWEVQSNQDESETVCIVRKKNCDFYAVPIAEYLAIRSEIAKTLGYLDQRMTARPEPVVFRSQQKFYLPNTGDVNCDGEVSVDDAQLTLKAYTNRIAGNDMNLTAEQIKAADINGDSVISVDDAQCILRYYTENTVAGNPITWDEILKKAE